jgi:putative oxidoreductase
MAVTTETRPTPDPRPDHGHVPEGSWADWTARMLSILRIGAALVFMLHGTMKLFGYPSTGQPRPELVSLIGLAGVLEVFGGLLVLLGLFTRPVAFVLAVEMMIAYGMAHLPQGIYPMLNQGEPAYLFFLIFLYLAVAGGGSWSLDHTLRGQGHRRRLD